MNKNEELLQPLKDCLADLRKMNIPDELPDDESGKMYSLWGKMYRTLNSILFQLIAAEIKKVGHPTSKPIKDGLFGPKPGSLVKIRPVGEEYGKKTFLGFYLGDVATGSTLQIKNDEITCEFAGHNPGIFVPALGKIIYGYESWWGEIRSEEELKDITDEDIEKVWYVKMFKALNTPVEKAKAKPNGNKGL